MQQLIVKHFGPIEYAEIEIKDLMIFIGPQASGKSTLAKLVYFYKKVIERLATSSIDLRKNIGYSGENFSALLTFDLSDIFNLGNYDEGQYFLGGNTELTFFYLENHIRILFTEKENDSVEATVNLSERFIEFFDKIDNLKSISNSDLLQSKQIEVSQFLKNFGFQDAFENGIYIPAGRILFSTFAEDLLSIKFQHLNNLEYFIKEYVNEANTQKQNARLTHKDSILAAKKKNKTDEKQTYFAEIAQEIIEHKILKGKYQYKDATEKIFFEKEKFIPFRYASSGQQEVNWIASCLFSMILKNESRFLVIEEPEAHLYPTGQKAIVELMGLTLNATKSPILLTTHSPYILTAFDNLIQAKEVSKLGNVDAETLAKEIDIPQACWIDFERVGVFYMADGKVEDIMDYERKAIGANKIDDVSEELGRVFDTLLHYKYKDA